MPCTRFSQLRPACCLSSMCEEGDLPRPVHATWFGRKVLERGGRLLSSVSLLKSDVSLVKHRSCFCLATFRCYQKLALLARAFCVTRFVASIPVRQFSACVDTLAGASQAAG